MSLELPAWYRELYLSKVSHKYNHSGFLMKPTVMPPARMDGKKLYFPVASPGTSHETKRGDTVKPMNAGRELIEVTSKWFEAPEYVYEYDLGKTSASEMEVITKNASDALGQRHDKVIMDAIDAEAGNYGTVVGGDTAAWDLDKAMQAETQLLEKTEVAREMLYCILPVRAFNQMMTYKEFASSDYVGEHPLAQGVRARTWGQTHYIMGYDAMFPVSGNIVKFYYYLRNAIGSGDTGGIKTDINRVPEKRAWLHDNHLEIGAKVLLKEGIVECKFDKSTGVSFA